MSFILCGQQWSLSDINLLKTTPMFLCLPIAVATSRHPWRALTLLTQHRSHQPLRPTSHHFTHRSQFSKSWHGTLSTIFQSCICSNDEFPKIVACRPFPRVARDQLMPPGTWCFFCGQRERCYVFLPGPSLLLRTSILRRSTALHALSLRTTYKTKAGNEIPPIKLTATLSHEAQTAWPLLHIPPVCETHVARQIDGTVTSTPGQSNKTVPPKATVSSKHMRHPGGESSAFQM